MTLDQILEAASWIVGGILVVYIICRILFRQKIITSKISNEDEVEGDQFYYLPATSITITATASVMVGLTEDGLIKKTKLYQLALDIETKIEPDTTNLIGLNYTEDVFSNDELSIVTTSESLLQNVSSSTEDRISQIIATVTDAPRKILDPDTLKERGFVKYREEKAEDQEEGLEVLVYEIRDYKRTFKIPAQETENSLPFEWEIILEGKSDKPQSVNASFLLKNNLRKPALSLNDKPFDGLFSRRIKNEKWEMHLPEKHTTVEERKFETEAETSFTCAMADISTVLKIPVRRAMFVKKVQVPKFSNGLLIENSVNKPSEVEAFLSIPINIGRALFSIPAALFQFKITQIKKQTEYENALTELLKTRQRASDTENTSDTRTDTDTLPVKPITIERFVSHKLPKLAKVEDITDRDENKIARSSKKSFPDIAFADIAGIGGLDLPPVPYSWAGNYIQWGVYQNDKLKTCVPAAAANQVLSWTINANPTQIKLITDAEVLEAYKAVTGYDSNDEKTDKGCDENALLNHWISTGIGGSTIKGFIRVKPDIELVKAVTYWFGGCLTSLNMPSSAKTMKDVWIYPSNQAKKFDLPGSWGRHTVPILGYNSNSLITISCGQKVNMTNEFFQHYSRDVYVCLSDDWLKNGKTITQKELTSRDLEKAMNNIDDKFNS